MSENEANNNLTAMIAESLLQHKISGQKLGTIFQEMKTKPGSPHFWPEGHNPADEHKKLLSSQASGVINTLCELADGNEINDDNKRYLKTLASLLSVIEREMIERHIEQSTPTRVDSFKTRYISNKTKRIDYEIYVDLDKVTQEKLREEAINQPELKNLTDPDVGIPNARAKLLALANIAGISLGQHNTSDRFNERFR